MDRRSDRRESGHQHQDGLARASATRRGRGCGRADAEAFAEFGQRADIRRRQRGQTDRACLLPAPRWPCALDAANAGGSGRRVEHCRAGQRQHDRADAQKNLLKPHLNNQWVIPPDANAAFVAAMEDVIEVYHRPHDADRPVVCVDETSKQLIIETRTRSRPSRAGLNELITNTSVMAPPTCS